MADALRDTAVARVPALTWPGPRRWPWRIAVRRADRNNEYRTAQMVQAPDNQFLCGFSAENAEAKRPQAFGTPLIDIRNPALTHVVRIRTFECPSVLT